MSFAYDLKPRFEALWFGVPVLRRAWARGLLTGTIFNRARAALEPVPGGLKCPDIFIFPAPDRRGKARTVWK